MSTDKEWEKWGKSNPYYGVLTDSKFRSKCLNEKTKKEFFDSGVSDVTHVLEIVRRHFNSNFSPLKALDFGCGTGRIVIPLSHIAKTVVGIDVSDSMLREAQKNCEEQYIKNVSFVKSDDALSGLSGLFDFIHSFIVFQHIPTVRGIKIFRRLLDHLEEDGACALHFTYANTKYVKRAGKPPAPWWRRLLRRSKRFFIGLFKQLDPEMEMNKYDLDELLFLLQLSGIKDFFAEYIDHGGGELGVYLYFIKPGKKQL